MYDDSDGGPRRLALSAFAPALDNPGHPNAAEAARTHVREHRDQWLRGYRDVLGLRDAGVAPHLTVE